MPLVNDIKDSLLHDSPCSSHILLEKHVCVKASFATIAIISQPQVCLLLAYKLPGNNNREVQFFKNSYEIWTKIVKDFAKLERVTF